MNQNVSTGLAKKTYFQLSFQCGLPRVAVLKGHVAFVLSVQCGLPRIAVLKGHVAFLLSVQCGLSRIAVPQICPDIMVLVDWV